MRRYKYISRVFNKLIIDINDLRIEENLNAMCESHKDMEKLRSAKVPGWFRSTMRKMSNVQNTKTKRVGNEVSS